MFSGVFLSTGQDRASSAVWRLFPPGGNFEEEIMHASKCEQAYLFQSGPDLISGRFRHRQGGTTPHHPRRSYCRRPASVPGGTGYPQRHRPTPEGQRTHAAVMPQPSSAAVSAAVAVGEASCASFASAQARKLTRSAASPLQITTVSLGCDLVLDNDWEQRSPRGIRTDLAIK